MSRFLRAVWRILLVLIVLAAIIGIGYGLYIGGRWVFTWTANAAPSAPAATPAPQTPKQETLPPDPAPKQEAPKPSATVNQAPIQGSPGPKGDQGPQGPKGDKGDPALTPNPASVLKCGEGITPQNGECIPIPTPTPTSSKLYVSDLQVADITPTSATVTIVTVNTGKGNQQYDVMAKVSSTSTWMKVGTFAHMGEGRSVGQTSLTDLKSGASYDVKVIWSGTDAASASFTTSTTPTPVPPPAPTPTPTTIVAKAVSLVSDNAQHERFRTTNGEERIRLTIKSLGTQPAGRRVWVEQAQAGISHYWLIGKVGDSSLELSNTFITSSGPWFKVHVESSVAEPGATRQVHPDLPSGAAYTVSTADWYKAENR